MAASAKKQPKKRMSRAARKEAISGYLYLLPNFIGFFIFTAIPIILGLLISFTDYNGFKWNFVGISNYIKMFGDSQFKAALVNNLVYSVVSVPLTIAFSLILALALNRKLFGGGFFKTVFFFPNLTSMVAIGCIAMLLFQPVDGPVNQVLRGIGIAQEHLPKWFMSTKTALLTVIIVVVWKQAGYYMIMFMGGLKSIPNHLYEAAQIDGANRWKQVWHVTLPGMRMIIVLMMVLSLGNVLNAGFDQIFNLYSKAVYESGDILDTFVYRLGLIDAQYGPATAVGLFKSIISTMFISVSYWLAYRFADYRIF